MSKRARKRSQIEELNDALIRNILLSAPIIIILALAFGALMWGVFNK